MRTAHTIEVLVLYTHTIRWYGRSYVNAILYAAQKIRMQVKSAIAHPNVCPYPIQHLGLGATMIVAQVRR